MTTTDPKLIEPVAWLREWRTIIGTMVRDVGLWKPSGDSPVKVTPLYTAAAINEAAHQWQDIANTEWIDGRDVVLFAHGMEVSARYCPGEWSDNTPISPREYSGAVWSCFDDQFQLEIEETSSNPAEWHHGPVTHWREPTPAQSKPRRASMVETEQVAGIVKSLTNDFLEKLLYLVETADPQATTPQRIVLMQDYAARVRLGHFREAFPEIAAAAPGPHNVRRESDEYACSCGKRWPQDEGEDHP